MVFGRRGIRPDGVAPPRNSAAITRRCALSVAAPRHPRHSTTIRYRPLAMSTTVQNYVGGGWRTSSASETLPVTNPASGDEIARVPLSSGADVDAAVQAAKAAFPAWRDVPGAERKKILHRVADRIVARAEEIALLECWDTGQALRFMSKAALRGAENVAKAPVPGNYPPAGRI